MRSTFLSVLRLVTVIGAFHAIGSAQTLAPTSLNFPNTAIGVASAVQTATLTNAQTVPLNITTAPVLAGANAADFVIGTAVITPCGTTIAPGDSCNIAVTFQPASSGVRSATLSITTDAPGTQPVLILSGTGIANATDTLSTNALSFGNNLIGVASSVMPVTVSNTGTDPLTITGIAISGSNSSDFTSTDTCVAAAVPSNSQCTISVTFTPSLSGPESATITLTDDAADSPVLITLTGTGVGSSIPVVSLSPTSLTFPNTALQQGSPAQTVILSNTGSAPLTITSIAIGGANSDSFAQTNDCGTSLAPATSCNILVTFAPTTTGPLTASIVFTDNAADSPESVALSGTGTATISAPAVGLSTTLLSFGSSNVGAPTAAQLVTLTNTGNANLVLTSITLGGNNGGDFAQSNNCGTGLAATQSCTISVTFNPTAPGARSANLIFTDNASDSPEIVLLSGIGVGVPTASVSPNSLTFANDNIGTTSPGQTVTLGNPGSATLTISSITISGTNAGDFAASNNCGSSIALSGTCNITVTFNATAAGARSAILAVTDNAGNSPQQVTLSGTGVGVPSASLNPSSVSFGNIGLGATTAPTTVLLANNGSGELIVANIALGGSNPGDFGVSNTCGIYQDPGHSCAIMVTFAPTTTGPRSATLVVNDNSNNTTGSTQSIPLTGTGVAPIASVSPASIGFGSGTPSQTVTLSNSGLATLNISSIALGGTNAGNFTIVTDSCGSTLNPNSSCVILISFTSTSSSSDTATLTITDDSSGVAGSTQTVTLSAQSPLTLSGTALAGGTVGSPYRASITPNGGTSPYTFAIADGSALPQGLTLNTSTGVISGTPTLAGSSTFTVKVTDSSSPQQSASASFSIAVITSTPSIPSFSFTNLAGTVTPGANITNGTIAWTPLSSSAYSGTLTLAFTPDGSVTGLPSGYLGDAGFVASDGTKASFTSISLPTATASMVALPTLDPGTVAGSLAVTLTIDGQPTSAATSSVNVQPAAPIIEAGSVQINNVTSTGFTVELVATSTTRDLKTATFTFTPAAGAQLNGTSFSVNVASLLTPWFASTSGLSYGGAFSLTIPFTLSGSASAIGSVSVTLTNSVGTSAAVSGVQ